MIARDFDRFLRRYGSLEVIQNASAAMDAAILAALTEAVLATRVDTGRLRGGWQLSVGEVKVEEVGLSGSANRTLSGENSLENRNLANPVEYAEYLNDGTATISADNMLGRAEQAALRALEAFNPDAA